MLRCRAGAFHITGFIAGATRTGRSVASITVEARSSARPSAILPMKSAVAGATTTRSVSRARRIWPTSCSSARENRSSNTVSAASAPTASGVTNALAPSVMTGRTAAPRSRQPADQVEGLVGGDAAGEDQQDPLAGQAAIQRHGRSRPGGRPCRGGMAAQQVADFLLHRAAVAGGALAQQLLGPVIQVANGDAGHDSDSSRQILTLRNQ